MLPAPTTLQAKDAGLIPLVDIAKANLPGLPSARGFTEQFIKQNPKTIAAFLKASLKAGADQERSSSGQAGHR